MHRFGISDSPAEPHRAKTCEACGSAVRLEDNACVSCMLRTALERAEGAESDSFDELLQEVNVRDSDWRLGNYQILEEIGRGGMGVIYRARQRHSRRVVALKRLLSYHGDSHDTLERFRREAEAAASLDHPNILPIYEVGEADSLPFFTMKYASGGSLHRAAAAFRGQPRECIKLIAKVARAVSHAHEHGILHRDLKPGNILLDAHGEPLVSDFGLAKWIEGTTDFTRSLAVFGTPGFIAPEQAEGPRALVGPAADIYSLGAILFELLAGRAPFVGDHALAVIRQASDNPAPKLRSLVPNLDRDLETICAKCLERSPACRYPSASALASDLERWLEGCPIVARPVSVPTRVWRWSKREPVLAATAAACVVLLAVSTTRQLHGWQLEKDLNAQVAAQHSIEVLPLLDIDSGQLSVALTRDFTSALEKQLSAIGPAIVRPAGAQPASSTNTSASGADPVAPPRALLTGTVRRDGGRTRVAVHLLNATNRAPLFSGQVEVAGDDAAAVASARVAGEIYARLSAADLTTVASTTSDPGLLSPETRAFIERGAELARRQSATDLDRAIACLKHATQLQPSSSAAHAALATTLAYKMAYQNTLEPLAAAGESARRAVALDPSSADAHLAVGGVLYQAGQVTEAIEEAKIALQCSPTVVRGARLLQNIYKTIGRPDLALAWSVNHPAGERGIRSGDANIGDLYSYLLRDDLAEAGYQRHLELHPEQPQGWIGICRLRLLNGNVADARRLVEEQIRGHGDFGHARQIAAQVEFFGRDFAKAEERYAQLHAADSSGGEGFYGAVGYASALGRIRLETDAAAGRALLEQAREEVLQRTTEKTEHPRPLYHLAAIYSSLGETAPALHYLGRAIQAGWVDFRSMQSDPRFDGIREEPEVRDFISAMKARIDQMNRDWPPAVAAARRSL